MTYEKECSECGERPAMMWLDDGYGLCWDCAKDYAEEQIEREEKEQRTGISEIEITELAFKKRITFKQAEKELIESKEAIK